MHQLSTRRSALAGALTAAVLLIVPACGDDSSTGADDATTTPSASDSPKVVASTSWVGAIAKLAGADDITVVAPSSAQHPPDYDPKASDLAAVADADYVLVAGFEGFAQRMKDAAGSDAKVETVTPDYDPAKVKAEVDKLAKLWGTTAEATANVAAYTSDYEAAADDLQASTKGTSETVVAQAFVAGWTAFAGFTPAGTYGPEPTTASKVAELTALNPTLVFENSHMGGGAEIASASGAELVNLVNFPGDDLDLMPVVEKNAKLITEATSG